MGARVLPFPRPSGEDVEAAWAAYRAILRAEAADATLRDDHAHQRARDKAEREFERLFAEWVRA